MLLAPQQLRAMREFKTELERLKDLVNEFESFMSKTKALQDDFTKLYEAFEAQLSEIDKEFINQSSKIGIE